MGSNLLKINVLALTVFIIKTEPFVLKTQNNNFYKEQLNVRLNGVRKMKTRVEGKPLHVAAFVPVYVIIHQNKHNKINLMI